VDDVRFRLGLRLVAVGWQVWVSLVMVDVLFKWGFVMVAVGWRGWVSWFVGVGLFNVELWLVAIE
jgi:hypothetical protein